MHTCVHACLRACMRARICTCARARTLTRTHTHQALLSPVAREVQQLRVLLEAREAQGKERVWLTRQTHGELDERSLVDGIHTYIYI